MINLRKVFDTMCHKNLLIKLDHYGIWRVPNKLLASYLKNRKQFASINEIKSNIINVKIGIPQGLILGPLLYIIYVNDIQCFKLYTSTLRMIHVLL